MVKWFCSPCTSSNKIEQQGRIYLQLQPKSSIFGGGFGITVFNQPVDLSGCTNLLLLHPSPPGLPWLQQPTERISQQGILLSDRQVSQPWCLPQSFRNKKNRWHTVDKCKTPISRNYVIRSTWFLVVDCYVQTADFLTSSVVSYIFQRIRAHRHCFPNAQQETNISNSAQSVCVAIMW